MPPATRKRRPKQRPREILDAALDLFSEKGFAATRLEDVAARAGLSKAAIYLYFDDKLALLQAIVREMATANVDTVRALAAAHQGPVGPLLERVLQMLGNRINHTRLPDLLKVIISESRAHPEIGRFYLENVAGQALPLLQSLIERGMAAGEFRRVDAALTVKCLIGPMVLAGIWRGVFEPIGAPALDAEALARQHGELMRVALSNAGPVRERDP